MTMTIDEAIKNLQTEAHLALCQPETGVYDALKLGIEALKVIDKARSWGYSFASILLPGETRD